MHTRLNTETLGFLISIFVFHKTLFINLNRLMLYPHI